MESISRINLPRVDSTNNFIRDMLSFGDELNGLTLVVAEAQTAGRGQVGNHWESEPGKNLTFSLLCHPNHVRPSEQFILSQCIALAVREALQAELNNLERLERLDKLDRLENPEKTPLTIKWPNDIYVGDRKICGILIECDLQGKQISNCIIGVGLNVNQTTFLSDAPNPVSLIQLTGKEHNREAILGNIVANFQTLYEQISNGEADSIRKTYMQYLYRRHGFHTFADVRGEFIAEIADIEPTGHLLLRFENGNICRYEFKEVKYIINV